MINTTAEATRAADYACCVDLALGPNCVTVSHIGSTTRGLGPSIGLGPRPLVRCCYLLACYWLLINAIQTTRIAAAGEVAAVGVP